MKKMTIWRRLNTSLALLILLLLVGAGLAWGVAQVRANAQHRSDVLKTASARIHLDLAQMNDAVRGQLLEPKSEVEKKRYSDAMNDLTVALRELQREFGGYEKLTESLKNLGEFARSYDAKATK